MDKKREQKQSPREEAVKQQKILEQKRKAKAEYNQSTGKQPVEDLKLSLENFHHENQLRSEEKKEQRNRIKKEKKQHRFFKGYRSSVAFDEVEGVSVSQWFLSICWAQIPVFGLIYLLVLICRRTTHPSKRNFAIGFLIYQALVLLLAGTILYVAYRVGLDLVDQVLSFAS